MATARSRTNSTSSNSSVGSDNSDILVRRTKNLLDQGTKNKNTIQRTRDALGDIGNRMKKNGNNIGNAAAKKPAFVIGKPALGLQNTGSFAVPIAPAPRAVRKDVIATKKPVIGKPALGLQNTGSSAVPLAPAPRAVPKDLIAAKKPVIGKPPLGLQNAENSAVPLAPAPQVLPKDVIAAKKPVIGKPALELQNTESSAVPLAPAPEAVPKDVIAAEKPVIIPSNSVTSPQKLPAALLGLDITENGFSKRFGVVDIDINNDEANYFLATDYIVDICDYLFDLEKRYPIRIRYLEGRLVNSRMRAVLMDWLVEVHNQFKFAPETLYIATKTMDRYLQIDRSISRKQLQLVGVTAMYIAAKFEEVCTPTVLDFAAVSDNAFSSSDVIKMEETMLRALSYDLAPPPACFFLRRFSKAASSSIQLHSLAKYIMELSLVDYSSSHLYPSQQAYGALSLAMLVLIKEPLAEMWDATMQHYSKTTLPMIAPVISIMAGVLSRAHEEPTKLQAVTNKYARTRAHRVSKFPELNVDEWKGRVAKELLQYK